MADTYGESYGGATGLTGWATEAVVCGVQHLRDRKEPVGWQVCSFGGRSKMANDDFLCVSLDVSALPYPSELIFANYGLSVLLFSYAGLKHLTSQACRCLSQSQKPGAK